MFSIRLPVLERAQSEVSCTSPGSIHSPKSVRRSEGDRGASRSETIPAGTTVAGFGGHVVDHAEFDELDEELRTHSLQIDERLYMVSLPPFAPADYVNHSCEPNCGIVGSCLLVTRCVTSSPAKSCASTTR